MDIRNGLVKTNNLTDGQNEFIEKVSKWYKDPDNLFFNLTGYAGTGKTFALRHYMKHVVNKAIIVTAPTHKAVKVAERAIGRSGSTLQALHGLKPNINLEDFNINKLKFDTMGTDKFGDYHSIICDEASQINSGLYQLNFDRAKQHRTKILYVSDPCQLPPVKERLSRVYSSDIKSKFQLTEIVRQEDTNPLLALFKLLRYDVEQGTSTFLQYIRRVPEAINDKGEGYKCLDAQSFTNEMLDKFRSPNFKSNVEYVRYSGWTNNMTFAWNKFIRDSIIGVNEPIIVIGDLLTGYKTIVDEYFTPLVMNSEDYVVKDVNKYISEDGFAYYRILVDAITVHGQYMFNVVDHKDTSYSRYVNKVIALHNNAVNASKETKGKAWRRYYEFKEGYITLQKITIPNVYGEDSIAHNEIDYGYGLTVHKMQGTTVHTNAVNLVDIVYYKGDKSKPVWGTEQIELRNKLIYTALSRASNFVMLLV